jgi:hypothetical protein
MANERRFVMDVNARELTLRKQVASRFGSFTDKGDVLSPPSACTTSEKKMRKSGEQRRKTASFITSGNRASQ